MINSTVLMNIFNIDGFSCEAIVLDDGYEVKYKFRFKGLIHEFKHKTLFSRIEKNNIDDKLYMEKISSTVKSDCISYFNKVKSFK